MLMSLEFSFPTETYGIEILLSPYGGYRDVDPRQADTVSHKFRATRRQTALEHLSSAAQSRPRRQRRKGLGPKPHSIRKKRNRMVEADQCDQLEDLLDTERR